MKRSKTWLRSRHRNPESSVLAAWSTPEKAIANLTRTLSKPGNRWLIALPLAIVIVGVFGVSASAQDEAPLTPEEVQGVLNAIWITIAAVLVIFMNAGFGMLETGFCRQKNAV
ncbi:MAG: ammonium transporter, partial [Leptolyngbyaceae cyanobacterium]